MKFNVKYFFDTVEREIEADDQEQAERYAQEIGEFDNVVMDTQVSNIEVTKGVKK